MPDHHAESEKSRLRLHARAARQSVPTDEREPLARAACERLLSLPRIATATTVLAYAASAEEIDPHAAVAELRSRGVRIAYPRVSGPGALVLHLVADETELLDGSFGLREPSEQAPSVATDEIDAVIVPGIAFDANGHRIGFGGGFYDRLLARMPHAYAIGLAFEGQMVPAIPARPHDHQLDAVSTPNALYRPVTER